MANAHGFISNVLRWGIMPANSLIVDPHGFHSRANQRHICTADMRPSRRSAGDVNARRSTHARKVMRQTILVSRAGTDSCVAPSDWTGRPILVPHAWSRR